MTSIFADLGNSRLKWGRPVDDGRIDSVSLPVDDPSAWSDALGRWAFDGPTRWSIATVNPAAAGRFEAFLAALPETSTEWYRSAADVPVRHALATPGTAGADRALAVVGALARRETGPGIVVMSGSATTVERIGADGTWQGGAIGVGLRLAATALHGLSPRLPLVEPHRAPQPWGESTVPALEAGVVWGTIGLVRALVAEQARGFESSPWVDWTGGDAATLIGPTALPMADVRLAPNLVLDGLRAVAGA